MKKSRPFNKPKSDNAFSKPSSEYCPAPPGLESARMTVSMVLRLLETSKLSAWMVLLTSVIWLTKASVVFLTRSSVSFFASTVSRLWSSKSLDESFVALSTDAALAASIAASFKVSTIFKRSAWASRSLLCSVCKTLIS